jgi:hypothetical protein
MNGGKDAEKEKGKRRQDETRQDKTRQEQRKEKKKGKRKRQTRLMDDTGLSVCLSVCGENWRGSGEEWRREEKRREE